MHQFGSIFISLFQRIYLHASKVSHELTSELSIVAVQVHHLLGEISFIHNLFFAGLSQLEILLFHFKHLVSYSVHIILDSSHFFMSVLKLFFHFFHLPCFLFQSFFILDQLIMNLSSWLPSQNVFQL